MGLQKRRLGTYICIVWLLGASQSLNAQAPTVLRGQSTTFAFYDPAHPPVPKAPNSPPLSPLPLPPLPVMSPADYQLSKSLLAPFVQSSFSGPSQALTSPVPPRVPGAAVSPIAMAPILSFTGIQHAPPQAQPPSPDLAVGPSDILMVINSSIAQFTKTGTQRVVTPFQDFFAALLPTVCPTGAGNCQIFDPCIRYDQLHGRFLFLATSRTLNDGFKTAYLLLSVTNGSTFDSGWKTWVLDVKLDGTVPTNNWGDFWRLGYDNVGIYLAGNQYNASQSFQYAKIRVVLKSDVFNLAATTLPYQDVLNLNNADSTKADSLTPMVQRGRPSAGTSPYFVNANNVTVNPLPTYLTVWQIADPTAVPLTVNRFTVTGLTPYGTPAAAPQLGGVNNCKTLLGGCLDSGDRRVLKAVSRSGLLYVARDAGYADAPITVTYDIVDTNGMAIASQSKLINSNSFYPAFDVPASTPPGFPFASPIVGTTTAPDGALTYSGIANLKPGEDYYDVNSGVILNRWGDYFGGAVDPVNGGLWTSGQYAAPKRAGLPASQAGLWGTWMGYFPWYTAPVFVDVPTSNPYFDYINVMRLWQITSGCGAVTFCPAEVVPRSQIAIFIIRAMLGDPCPDNTPCSTGFTYSTTAAYTDVPASDMAFPYVQKLRDLGLSFGCSPTTFCPAEPLLRSSAAILAVRGKLKSLFGDNFTYPATPYYTDTPQTVSTYPYIQKLTELGILTGCTATQFCPNQALTRQEAAALVVRAFLN